jgi:hypothetical protein
VGIVESGGIVSAWLDGSGQAHNVSQSNPSKRPLYLANGGPNNLPCVAFDGIDDFLQAFWPQSQPLTTIIAMMPSVTGGKTAESVLDGAGGNDRNRHYFGGGINVATLFAGAAIVNGSYPETSWQYWISTLNGASSSLGINGASPVSGNAGTNAPSGVTLGARGAALSQFIDCRIVEVIQYNRVLSSAELSDLSQYVGEKIL